MRFLGAFLLLLFAITLSFKMELFMGWSFDIVLALLIALATLLSLEETVLLTGFAAFVINWRPGFAPELTLLIAVPILTALFKKYLPWRRSFTPAIMTAVAMMCLYSIAGTLAASRVLFMASNMIISIAAGYLALIALGWAWGKRSGERPFFA